MGRRLYQIFHYLRLVICLIRLNRNPDNTELVFDVADSLYQLNSFQQIKKILQADPGSLALIAEKKVLPSFPLSELAKLPEGTLGRAYAEHMLSRGLVQEFYRRPAKITDETYVFLRLRQTHDLWHVVTGYDTSILGELSLQSFMLAQLASPLSILLVSTSLLSTAFKQQERLVELMEGLIEGWKKGRQSQLLFAFDWESSWNRPLAEIRSQLGLVSHSIMPEVSAMSGVQIKSPQGI